MPDYYLLRLTRAILNVLYMMVMMLTKTFLPKKFKPVVI